MGREWLHWAGGGRATRRRTMAAEDTTTTTTTTSPGRGCMCAVFHLFDLHPFQFPLNHHHHPDSTSFLNQEAANSSKGIEAPRNSLETEAAAMIQEQSLNFPEGLQIKTRVSTKSGTEEICSSTSPGTSATTPSLMARLMGLDMLPQCTSPSSSSSTSRPPKKSHFSRRKEGNILGRRSSRSFSNDDINVGVRSLPETPRMSLGRRSDVECHRLSLNVNKENVSEEILKRRGRSRQDDQDRSPGHYAKQIVNQVRERVGRRVGLDITNIIRDSDLIIRRDENLILLKSSKSPFRVLPSLEEGEPETKLDEGKSSLRFSDMKKNKQTTKSTRISSSCHKGISDPSKSNNQAIMQEHYRHRITGKFSPQAIRNKKEEQFVHSRATDKKPKKAPLSRELLNTSGPTPLPVKKAPSPPATKLPQKQTRAPSVALASKRNTQLCNSKKSYPYYLLQPVNAAPDSNNRRAAEYRHYIERIIKRAGIIDGVTPLKLGKWHTPSHPLDPSIFYYLELFHPGPAASTTALSRRCNRKLIFQLVDELLAEILKPHLEFKPWTSHSIADHRFGLIDELCKKMDGFPAANCQVLEDIDSLIDKDLGHWEFLEEEGAKLAREIEGEIMDSLLTETVTFSTSVPRNNRYRSREMSRGLPRE